MGKKLSLNEEKFKVAFIFLNEGCNPKKDRSVTRICKAVDRKIPVGAVNFDLHPVFRDKSGDDLFQKDFWCIGL